MELSAAIDKIRKLLALANNAGTEAEASLAAQRAQELLAAYNLEMSQIDAAPDRKATSADSRRVKDTYQRSAMFAYQRQLWDAIAKCNYCWYEPSPVYGYIGTNYQIKTYHHYLIGREANVVATRMMGDYLEKAISRLCPFKPGRDSSKSWISWKEGCAARLCERLWDKRREMEEQSSRASSQAQAAGATSTALMTLRDVATTEDDENYRFVHGEDAYQRRMSYRHNVATCECRYCTERREWNAKWDEEKKNEVVVPESPAERKARLHREEVQNRRWERQADAERRKRERDWNNKDKNAYWAGARTADDISLDSQIPDTKPNKEIDK